MRSATPFTQSPWASTNDVVLLPVPKQLICPNSCPPSGEPGIPSSFLVAPSTPERQQSSLPTPDFTLSIKSFRHFRSPSPEPSARSRGRGILKLAPSKSDVNLKAGRRVRFETFAPESSQREEHPDSMDLDNDEDHIEAGLPSPGPRRKVTAPPQAERRASSPPPMLSIESLPAEVEKFQKHFEVMTSRGSHGMKQRPRVSLLPGASQQYLGSPSPDAMAERFREVDAVAISKLAASPRRSKNETAQLPTPDDDISAVLDNLDDFLEVHDVGNELSQARAAAAATAGGKIRLSFGLEANPWQ
jgi:hypothetical protein